MPPKAFQILLVEFRDLARLLNDPAARSAVLALPDLLEGASGKDVATYLDKVRRKPDDTGPRSGAPHGVSGVLSKLASLLLLAGGKTPAADVERLSTFLSEWGDTPVPDVVAMTRAVPPPPPTRRTAAKPREAPAPKLGRGDLAARYAAELRASSGVNAEFDNVIERMKKDKLVRLEELREITGLYLGVPAASGAKKPELFKKITDAQALDARQRARAGLTG